MESQTGIIILACLFAMAIRVLPGDKLSILFEHICQWPQNIVLGTSKLNQTYSGTQGKVRPSHYCYHRTLLSDWRTGPGSKISRFC